MHDVQPSAHDLVFVELHGLPFPAAAPPAGAAATPPATAELYGEGVDHSSPLTIVPHNAPTWLASRLAAGSPAVATNTTARGLCINPYLIADDEIGIVAARIAHCMGEALTNLKIQWRSTH